MKKEIRKGNVSYDDEFIGIERKMQADIREV